MNRPQNSKIAIDIWLFIFIILLTLYVVDTSSKLFIEWVGIVPIILTNIISNYLVCNVDDSIDKDTTKNVNKTKTNKNLKRQLKLRQLEIKLSNMAGSALIVKIIFPIVMNGLLFTNSHQFVAFIHILVIEDLLFLLITYTLYFGLEPVNKRISEIIEMTLQIKA